MTKRYDDPIEVSLSDLHGGSAVVSYGLKLRPRAFSWKGRRYHVDRLLKYWREAGEAYDLSRAIHRECFRVEAEGGTYDLALERLSARAEPHWKLARVWD